MTIAINYFWRFVRGHASPAEHEDRPDEQIFATSLERLGNDELQCKELGRLYVKMPRGSFMDTEAGIVRWVCDADTLRSIQALTSWPC